MVHHPLFGDISAECFDYGYLLALASSLKLSKTLVLWLRTLTCSCTVPLDAVGALCWSLNIFRLSSWVNKGIEPVALQAWKTIILSGMYFMWMFIEVAKSGWAWNLLWPGIAGSAVGLAVLAFSAIGPGWFPAKTQ